MTIKGDRSMDRAEWLSALADGELAPDEVPAACVDWREDADARSRWHCYQLIGDVLRSDDLASTARHDAEFLDRLRQRLENEPVVLAPAALAAAPATGASAGVALVAAAGVGTRRRRWLVPSAVAATFAAVVVGGVMMPATSPPTGGPALVAGSTPRAVPVSTDPNAVPDMPVITANGRLIRDARIDRYLAAHQQWSGGAVIGGHAAYLRQVSADAATR